MAKKEVKITLLPPFKKKGHSGKFTFKIPEGGMTLRQLANCLSQDRPDVLGFKLSDPQGNLHAQFIVNGRSASPEQLVADADVITIFKRIGGG